ncbi:hypothetical protein ACLB2K_012315 [Fragaria x ananassa]
MRWKRCERVELNKLSSSIMDDGLIHKEELRLALFQTQAGEDLFLDREGLSIFKGGYAKFLVISSLEVVPAGFTPGFRVKFGVGLDTYNLIPFPINEIIAIPGKLNENEEGITANGGDLLAQEV